MQCDIYKTQCIICITQCVIYKTQCVIKFFAPSMAFWGVQEDSLGSAEVAGVQTNAWRTESWSAGGLFGEFRRMHRGLNLGVQKCRSSEVQTNERG